MERVKFYPRNDFFCGHNLRKCESIIKEYGFGEIPITINDVIELYNIQIYFKNEIYPINWTPENIIEYTNKVNNFTDIIISVIKQIDNESIIKFYNEVDFGYTDDFWQIVDKFKVYKKIAEDKFRELIKSSNIHLYEILRYKDIVKYFSGTIRDFLLDNCSTAELLLDEYELKHLTPKEPFYFPKALTNSDKENILSNYIESEEVNLNYLQLIVNIKNSIELQVSPKIILRAKKKKEILENELFDENSGIKIKTSVGFSKSQIEEVLIEEDGLSRSETYSSKWIENNQDYPTLLNNFIYLFRYVDLQMRCNLVGKLNKMDVLDRFVFMTSRNAYKTDMTFNINDHISFLQIYLYYNELFGHRIRLEEIIEWFFDVYLAKEFNALNFKIKMPSVNTTLLEKCTTVMPAMEMALKQFSLYQKEGEIDYELLEIRTEAINYKNIPSLVRQKYYYGCGDNYKRATHYLFSDQSGLGYCSKLKKPYKFLYNLLVNEKLKLNDFETFQQPDINWLIENHFLSIDKCEVIVFKNEVQVLILKDLYFNDVINYWNLSVIKKTIIYTLEIRGFVECESTLFSRPEQAYFNYYLNMSQFNNGLDLRNKYAHTQPNIQDNASIHNNSYMIFLRLFVITVIKINDDFCASKKSQELENSSTD